MIRIHHFLYIDKDSLRFRFVVGRRDESVKAGNLSPYAKEICYIRPSRRLLEITNTE